MDIVSLLYSRFGHSIRWLWFLALASMKSSSVLIVFCPTSWGSLFYVVWNHASLSCVYSSSLCDLADELTWLILSALPVCLIGLAEDLGYNMSPKLRLVASMISSVVALMVFKVWLSKLGVPGLDILLLFTPFAILFTIFATVGVVNAFNLIDGLNGLSSYVSISVATSLSIIAFQVGNFQLAIFLSCSVQQ